MRLDAIMTECLTVSCRGRMIGKGDESQTKAGVWLEILAHGERSRGLWEGITFGPA